MLKPKTSERQRPADEPHGRADEPHEPREPAEVGDAVDPGDVDEEPEVEVRGDGRVSRAARLREERRTHVLATALALFGDRGYHATSIQDIIGAAGIARGTFYLYFESKRAIFSELLERFFATIAGVVRRVDVGPGAATPLEQMHDNVRRVFSVLDHERPMARILIREAVGLDEEFDRKLRDFYGRVTALIERALRLGKEMGLVRDLDPALVSWCVLGSIKEVIERAFVAAPVALDAANEVDSPIDLEAARRELVEFNLRALFR